MTLNARPGAPDQSEGLGTTITRRARCVLFRVPLAAAPVSAAPAALAAGPTQHRVLTVRAKPSVARSALAGLTGAVDANAVFTGRSGIPRRRRRTGPPPAGLPLVR
jgi:hypothetical protein